MPYFEIQIGRLSCGIRSNSEEIGDALWTALDGSGIYSLQVERIEPRHLSPEGDTYAVSMRIDGDSRLSATVTVRA